MKYRLIVMGASFGGMKAFNTILPQLPETFDVPIAIVQHLGQHSNDYLIDHLNEVCRVKVKEADEKENLRPGVVYFAPADYHLLVEDDLTLSLSVEAKVNFSRPSIDVLFESAALALREDVIGIILTGANNDGSFGLKKIKDNHGLTIVQKPETAKARAMPQAAIESLNVDHIISLAKLGPFLVELIHSE